MHKVRNFGVVGWGISRDMMGFVWFGNRLYREGGRPLHGGADRNVETKGIEYSEKWVRTIDGQKINMIALAKSYRPDLQVEVIKLKREKYYDL